MGRDDIGINCNNEVKPMSGIKTLVRIAGLALAINAATLAMAEEDGVSPAPDGFMSSRTIGFGSGSGIGPGGAFGNAGSIVDGVGSFAAQTGVGNQYFGGGFQTFGLGIEVLGITDAGPLAGELGGIDLGPVLNATTQLIPPLP